MSMQPSSTAPLRTGKVTGLHGTGMKAVNVPQFTGEQNELFRSLFGHLGPQSYLSRLAGGDEGLFEQMERPAHRQFQQALGQLGSRFSGAGMGARRGSGFNLAGGQLASDFAENLQAQRMGLQRQAMQDLFGMSGMLMGQRPTETSLVSKKDAFWKDLLVALSGGIGQGIGSLPALAM